MLLSANIAVEQEVIVAAIVVALFIFRLHASDVHQHMFNRSQVATLLLGRVSKLRLADQIRPAKAFCQ